MEKHTIQNNITVFGAEVTTFPNGISEAFNKLMKELPKANERPYYGISYCTNGSVTYIAAALETFEGEGKKYGYENYTIDKGEYLTKSLTDWTSKTHLINDVFAEIIKDKRADNTQPAIEIYNNMKEMMCMVKMNASNNLAEEFDKTIEEIKLLLSSVRDDQLNIIPFEGSWTAGQLLQHVILSAKGFAEIVSGPVKDTERSPDELVEKIKKDFLDFSIKMKSPEFVRPENKSYLKQELLHSLEDIKTSIDQAIATLDLTQTCIAFDLPGSGFLTRLEAISFVIYHTQRHIHQLKNIMQTLRHPVG